jgi:hypothetical protein
VHENFDNIYADNVPMSPPHAEITQPDNLEDLYVYPLPQVAQQDDTAVLDAKEIGRVVHFFRYACFVSKLFFFIAEPPC